MTEWICKGTEKPIKVEELKERFRDDLNISTGKVVKESKTKDGKKLEAVLKDGKPVIRKVRKRVTKKTEGKKDKNPTYTISFRPKYWYELQREIWIDEKLRSMFKTVELRVSRSFNGFIENFAISDHITTDKNYYLKNGKRKVWIGYKGIEPLSSVIKRVFLKGIKMGLIPTAWED